MSRQPLYSGDQWFYPTRGRNSSRETFPSLTVYTPTSDICIRFFEFLSVTSMSYCTTKRSCATNGPLTFALCTCIFSSHQSVFPRTPSMPRVACDRGVTLLLAVSRGSSEAQCRRRRRPVPPLLRCCESPNPRRLAIAR